jgi:hypothetical protein
MPGARYTRKDAEAAYERLCEVLGKRDGTMLAIDDPPPPGPYPEGQTFTAESIPLDDRRRSAREFSEAIWFALRVLKASE